MLIHKLFLLASKNDDFVQKLMSYQNAKYNIFQVFVPILYWHPTACNIKGKSPCWPSFKPHYYVDFNLEARNANKIVFRRNKITGFQHQMFWRGCQVQACLQHQRQQTSDKALKISSHSASRLGKRVAVYRRNPHGQRKIKRSQTRCTAHPPSLAGCYRQELS